MDELLRRARIAWAGYAGLDDGFRPGQVHLGVNAGSGLCPPGWAGIVVLGDAAIVTAPAAQAERELRGALRGVPVARLTDPSVVVPAGRAAAVLGPANLAFTDPARFAGPGASPRPATQQMPVTDQRVQRLLSSVSAEDAAETDLARMDSAVHVVLDGDRAVAAAGYLTWPGGVAHLSVLTDTACRGRGLAKLAGAAATADALARGLLPQWRARVPASIRAAASLGFVSCGSQLCIRLGCPDADQG
jgi:GNAT acetyltransferase